MHPYTLRIFTFPSARSGPSAVPSGPRLEAGVQSAPEGGASGTPPASPPADNYGPSLPRFTRSYLVRTWTLCLFLPSCSAVAHNAFGLSFSFKSFSLPHFLYLSLYKKRKNIDKWIDRHTFFLFFF